MEKPPFVDYFPVKTSVYRGFPAMFEYQRVCERGEDSLKLVVPPTKCGRSLWASKHG